MAAHTAVAWEGYLHKKVSLEMRGRGAEGGGRRGTSAVTPAQHPPQASTSFFGRSAWQRRYFVLTGDATVKYFASAADAQKGGKAKVGVAVRWLPRVRAPHLAPPGAVPGRHEAHAHRSTASRGCCGRQGVLLGGVGGRARARPLPLFTPGVLWSVQWTVTCDGARRILPLAAGTATELAEVTAACQRVLSPVQAAPAAPAVAAPAHAAVCPSPSSALPPVVPPAPTTAPQLAPVTAAATETAPVTSLPPREATPVHQPSAAPAGPPVQANPLPLPEEGREATGAPAIDVPAPASAPAQSAARPAVVPKLALHTMLSRSAPEAAASAPEGPLAAPRGAEAADAAAPPAEPRPSETTSRRGSVHTTSVFEDELEDSDAEADRPREDAAQEISPLFNLDIRLKVWWCAVNFDPLLVLDCISLPLYVACCSRETKS